MNRDERIEELASRYVLGTLEEGELAELEELLRSDEGARRLFAELCTDEMLLWQHMNLEAVGSEPLRTPEPVPTHERAKPLRRLVSVAALFLAFLAGWLLSDMASARQSDPAVEVAEQPTEPAVRLLYPPPSETRPQVVYPLGFDEEGRLTLQPTRTQAPLEIANL